MQRDSKGRFVEGIIPWNKGRTGVYTKEHLEKMSQSHKGFVPWCKGKKIPDNKKGGRPRIHPIKQPKPENTLEFFTNFESVIKFTIKQVNDEIIEKIRDANRKLIWGWENKEYARNYQKNHLEKKRLENKIYRENIPDYYKLHYQKYYKEQPKEIQDKYVLQNWMYRKKLKTEVMSHYSNGTMMCNCCKKQGLDYLTLDHIIPLKQQNRKFGPKLYPKLKTDNFPKGYQVLCWNCNGSKRDFKQCAHIIDEERLNRWNNYFFRRNRKLKWKVFSHYCNGIPYCKKCKIRGLDFLTIDHVDGRNKFNHPKRFGGQSLYHWLQKNNHPKGIQILCWNCNAVKGMVRYPECNKAVSAS